MTPSDHRANIRALLDGSRVALETAIEAAVKDVVLSGDINETLRSLITGERALADDDVGRGGKA